MDGVRLTSPFLDLTIVMSESIPRDFESEPGSIPVGALQRREEHGACLLPGSLLYYFCQLILRVSLLVFLLVSTAVGDKNYHNFNWLWY
jgi:hypothetical protein